MRVMIAAGVTPTVGGVSAHINSLCRALRAMGHEAVVVTPLGVSREFKAVSSKQSRMLATLFRLPGVMLGAYFISQALLSRQIKNTISSAPYDIIHAQDVSATNAALLLPEAGRPPVVLTIHGYLTAEAVADRKIKTGGLAETILLKQEKAAYQRAKTIVTVDKRLAEHSVWHGAEPRRLVTMPNSVDTDRFRPRPDSRAIARESLGIRDDQFVVLCPRRLVAKNGVEYLIQAVPAMLGRFEGVGLRLLLAGTGQQAASLHSFARNLGVSEHVTFLGLVPHERIPSLYAAADVVVIPSVTASGVQEATSIAALEAMCSGKPVVASNIGGLREIIEDGATGLLVPERDPLALASAILRLRGDPTLARRLGESASNCIEQKHSSLAAARMIVSIYMSTTLG